MLPAFNAGRLAFALLADPLIDDGGVPAVATPGHPHLTTAILNIPHIQTEATQCISFKSQLSIVEFYPPCVDNTFKRGSYDAITGQSLNYASIPLCAPIPFHYPAPPALAVAKLNQPVGKLAQASRGNQVTSRPNGLFPKKGGEINRVGMGNANVAFQREATKG